MNHKKLIQWIRKNDEIYSEVKLSIYNYEELLFIKGEIKCCKNKQHKKRYYYKIGSRANLLNTFSYEYLYTLQQTPFSISCGR
jgi:hypothetical protein